MAPELTSVTVRIYGWDYTLKVEPSEVERAKQLADYLDQRMQQVAKKSGTADLTESFFILPEDLRFLILNI